jgi:AbrB family looped-hinge helix DNA binding protein
MVAKAVKVTRKGQITLPVELRKEFDIKEGDIVYVRKGEHGIEITTPEEIVARTAGLFKKYADKLGPLEPDEIREHAARYWAEDAMAGIEFGEDNAS